MEKGKGVSLGKLQQEFAHHVARLIQYAESLGYGVTFGDAFRDPRVTYGHPKSVHRQRLAVDLNLFKNGIYLTATNDHLPLGTWWKAQHPSARWGGDFEDGNHYSFEYEGMK